MVKCALEKFEKVIMKHNRVENGVLFNRNAMVSKTKSIFIYEIHGLRYFAIAGKTLYNIFCFHCQLIFEESANNCVVKVLLYNTCTNTYFYGNECFPL